MSGNNLPLHAIQPPPETTYSSHDAAEAALHQWTLDHGFNVSRRRVRYKGGPEREVWARNYECDRAGAPKNTQHLTEHDRKRTLRGSKRSACPMRIGIRAVDKDDTAGQWEIFHTARSTHHNHQPSRDVRVHAQHRRRAIQATSQPLASHTLELVELQTAAGATPSTIHATVLSADPRSLIVAKDISNAKDASRRHDLASRTATEALFQELVKHKFFYKFRLNPETNEVTHLFWAHPATTALFKFHFDVLVADCTYKTNKYRLPLLNIIVITGANSVLPVAQCWLPGEKDEDFVWAFNMLRLLMIENDIDPARVILTDRDLACLNALDRVFPDIPSMVCRWHMNKNVEAMARKHLGQVDVENPAPGQPKKENSWQTNSFMASFYEAVDAETEADFNAKREDLIEKCKPVSDYLDLHWWKYKTRIVKHCTNKYMHFGVRDTSTVEGTHAKIKSKLKSSQGDLYTVFKKLLSWWTIAASETRLLMEQNAVNAPHIFQKNRYSRVVRIITRAALGETERLWKDAEKIVNSGVQRSKCSGVFRVVHGRPCLHELISIVESNGQRFLAPHDFDKHWWIYRDQDKHTVPRIQEPATIRTIRKGKRQAQHRKNQGKRGTGRDPTFGERMDLSHPATPPTMVGLPPIDMQQFGSHEGDVVLRFEDAFLPPRSWGFAGRIPFTDQQPNEKQ